MTSSLQDVAQRKGGGNGGLVHTRQGKTMSYSAFLGAGLCLRGPLLGCLGRWFLARSFCVCGRRFQEPFESHAVHAALTHRFQAGAIWSGA